MSIQNKVEEFFLSHTEATECYEALGTVFAEKGRAEKYLKGVSGRTVTTHTREGVDFEKVSDELRYKIAQQNNEVNEKQMAYEAAPSRDKEKFMGEWTTAQEKLNKMEMQLEKQLSMEEKDELLSKEQKPFTPPMKKVLTREELVTAIAEQEKIVTANKNLVETAKPAKKAGMKKKVEAEERKLSDLKAQLENYSDDQEEEEMIDHVVTQEDLDNNPELFPEGVEVGETIQIPMIRPRSNE